MEEKKKEAKAAKTNKTRNKTSKKITAITKETVKKVPSSKTKKTVNKKEIKDKKEQSNNKTEIEKLKKEVNIPAQKKKVVIRKEKEGDTIKNRISIVILSLIIIFSIAFSIYTLTNRKKITEEEFDGNITHQELLANKEIDGLNIINQTMYVRDGVSTYGAIVTNNTDSDKIINNLIIIFTVNGEKIETIALKDAELKAGRDTLINVTFDKDVSEVTAIDFILE